VELSAYLRILNRRKWIVIVTAVITAVVFHIGLSLIPTTYEVTAILRITDTSGNLSYWEFLYAERSRRTYVKTATSSPVLGELRGRLGLDRDLPSSIEVAIIPETDLLRITVKDRDPILARDAANALAVILSESPMRGSKVSIIEPARTPAPPTIRNDILYGALALITGVVGGTGLAFLLEILDTTLHTTEQIEAVTGLPILGEIPTAKRRKKDKFLVDTLLYDDVFRRLRTNILSMSQGTSSQTLLITSAEPYEGKSTIVANLGRSMALMGCRTAIVDADLHCPTIHRFFDCPNEVGLSSVLGQNETLSEALQESQFFELKVLTSGPPFPHPAELLGSDRMIALLEQLKKRFDIVLLDTPAFLGVADTAVLAPAVDGVVLVARCGSVSEGPLRATCQQLAKVQAKPVGVVVNRVKKAIPHSYQRYYQQARLDQVASEGLSDATQQHRRGDLVTPMPDEKIDQLPRCLQNENAAVQAELR
jgi:capsular exopolysaccharide synthesis family protein